jgi:hypothetical protein
MADFSIVDDILDLLMDGNEHAIGEFLVKTRLSLKKLMILFDFLRAYEFVKVNFKLGIVKINPVVKGFLKGANQD